MLLALLVPTVFAAPKLPAGKVTLTDAVEVPLYAGLDSTDNFWYVEAKIGETPLLLRVSTGTQKLLLTDGGAKKAGVKGTGKEKKGTIKELTLGTAKFESVTAYVGSTAGKAGTAMDGEIGLGAFPDLSWAILPSSGVLKVGPAASGAAWVSSLGNALAYTTGPAKKVKVGKEKLEYEEAPYIVALPWSGVSIPTELTSNTNMSDLAAEATDKNRWWRVEGMELPTYDLPAAPTWKVGEGVWESRSVKVGGVEVPVAVKRPGFGYGYVTRQQIDMGMDVLANFDLAIDAAGHQIGMRALTERKLADYGPTYEAKLRKALEAAPGKDGKAPEADVVKDTRAGGIPALATWLGKQGKTAEALTLTKELTDLKPEICTSWLAWGESAAAAGQPADAITAFQKAGDLYEPWAKKPLTERQKLAADYAKAQKKKESWGDVLPQDHSCHVAWGELAAARVAAGQADKVADLYPAKLDLDNGLPIAAGVASLVRGDSAAAEAAFRQALHLNPGDARDARYGLFLALSNRSLANDQLEGGYLFDANVSVAAHYADAIRKIDGGPKAVEALKAVADKNLTNAALQIELARQYTREGNADAAKGATSAARKLLTTVDAAHSRNIELRAAWAMLLLAEGDTAGASTAAEALTRTNPNGAIGWWTASQVAEAAGDTAKAGEYARKAGIIATVNPLYGVALAR